MDPPRSRTLSITLAVALLVPVILVLMIETAPLVSASPGSENWYSLDWVYRKQITIDHTKVENENFANFPVLISITDSAWGAHVGKDNGDDILFTDSDGITKLNYEIESFVKATGTLVAWVQVPTLYDNENTIIYMYYGNASASNQESKTGVWDANFVMVQHLKETSGTIYDSTSNANNGAPINGAAFNSGGKIDGAYNFDGSNDYVSVPDAPSLNYEHAITVMCWFKADTLTGDVRTIMSKGSSGEEFASWYLHVRNMSVNKPWFNFGEDDGRVESTTTISTGTWYHIAVTFSNADNTVRLYLNGVLQDTAIHNWVVFTGNYPLWIGCLYYDTNPGAYFDGIIDEVQLSNTARSAGWLKTSYNNQNSPSTFYSMGGETSSSPTLVSPSNGAKTNDNTPTLNWDNPFVADNWEIWIDNNSDYSSTEFLENRTENTCTLPDEKSLADDNYSWRVRGYTSGGVRNFSADWTFVVDTTPPLTPSLISPGINDVTDQTTLTFRWNSVSDDTSKTTDVSGVKQYELWVDNNSDFSSPAVLENVSGTSQENTLDNGGIYYWKVRAWDWAGNFGAWSEPRKFTIENFTLSISADQIMIARGTEKSVTVSAELTLGTPSTVSLVADWVGNTPSGVIPNLSFTSGTMSLDNTFNSTLTFPTSSGADIGTFTYRITATSANGVERTSDVAVSITTMVFSVSVSPTTIALMRSDTTTLDVSVIFENGTPENVSLSGNWIGPTPGGVFDNFVPTSGVPSFSSVLTFTTTKAATAGRFTYEVKGTADGGVFLTVDVTVNILTAITITAATDNDTYDQGQVITVSGIAIDPESSVVENGTVTILIVNGSWSRTVTSAIEHGAYSASYATTLDNPIGTWTIFVSAVDSYGNETPAPENVTVTVYYPGAYRYYQVTFSSPVVGMTFSRGQAVSVTVQVKENNNDISGANVVLITFRGDNVPLTESAVGVYSSVYTLPWNTPTGSLDMMVVGEKEDGGVFKGGTNLTIVNVTPATLNLGFISPTEGEVEAGATVEVKVRARYSDGSVVNEGIIIINNPRGEDLRLTAEWGGIYSATYTIGDDEVGTWSISISAVDAYSNSGSMIVSVEIVQPGAVRYIIRYWPVVLAAVLGVVAASAVVAHGHMRTRRLGAIKREKQQLEKLKKEVAIDYFKTGSISRETYDNLTKEYATKLTDLDKEERLLMDKMKKKKLSEKKH